MTPMTPARPGRFTAGPLVIDLLLALAVALVLATTVRGEPPRTGLATSENFTIWADSQPEAVVLLERAEAWRRQIACEWLGEPLPDGAGRTSLNVQVASRDAAHAWLAGGSLDAAHLVWLRTTREKLDSALAHEIAHIVLATRFRELPAFAQEGVAGRYDDDERHALRRRRLAEFVRSGRWPRLHDVLRAERIAPSDRDGYATSVSLTQFLLLPTDRGDAAAARTLLLFADEGRRTGRWDQAVFRHYGFSSVAAMEREWREFVVRSARQPPAIVDRTAASPPGVNAGPERFPEGP